MLDQKGRDRQRGREIDLDRSAGGGKEPARERSPEELATERVYRVQQETASIVDAASRLSTLPDRAAWHAERTRLNSRHAALVKQVAERAADASVSVDAQQRYAEASKHLRAAATSLQDAREPRPVPPVSGEEAIEPSIQKQTAVADDVLAWVAGLSPRERSAIAERVHRQSSTADRSDGFAVALSNYLAATRKSKQFQNVAKDPRRHFNQAAYVAPRAGAAAARPRRGAAGDAGDAGDAASAESGTRVPTEGEEENVGSTVVPARAETPASMDRPRAAPGTAAPPQATTGDFDRREGPAPKRVGPQEGGDVPTVQRKATGDAPEGEPPDEVANRGVAGTGGPLPYLAQIQASFGHHDLSGVTAHQGAATSEAARSLGARAFAIGNAVGFDSSPNLHDATHEAAHVVQQRRGVQLKGGIDGGAGDPYERHADQVADAVVAGQSAEALLDAGPRGSAQGSPVVQRKEDTGANTARASTDGHAQEHGGAAPAPAEAAGGAPQSAAAYFADHQAPFFAAIRTRLASLSLPPPHARLVWGTDGLRGIALERALVAASGTDMDLALALPALLYPADPFQIIDTHRDLSAGRPGEHPDAKPALGPTTWNPIVGQAIALEVEASLRGSLPRMGLRYVAQADDAHDAVQPDQLVASTPFDRVVARLLCDPAVVRFVPTHGKAAKPDDTASPAAFKNGIRLVMFQWQGARDPKLWNWIRVLDPVDAKPEEVAASVFERGDGQNHTEYAYALTASPPFFRIPPDTARRFADAAQYAPRADVHEDLQAQSALDLADSPLGEDAARAQAGRSPGKLDISALQKTLAQIDTQLELANERLLVWNLNHLIGPARRWVDRHQEAVIATPDETLHAWAAVAAAQSATLLEATGELLEVTDLAKSAHAVPGTPEAKPFRDVIEAFGIAIGESHLAQSGQAQLHVAKRQKAVLSLTLLDGTMRDSHDAAQALAEADHVPVSDADHLDPRASAAATNQTLEAGALALRGKALATGAIDSGELDALAVAASEETLRTRLLTLYSRLDQLSTFSDDAIEGFFGHVANLRNAAIWNLREQLVLLKPAVWEILETLRREALPPQLPQDPVQAQASFAKARRLAVAHAQASLAQLSEANQLQTIFQRALSALSDAQRNTAYVKLVVEIAALIGVSIVGGVAGSLVGGLVRGAMLADAATDAAVLARTATAARWVGGAANVATDAAVQSAAQTTLFGGNTQLTFVENVMANLMTLGALRPFHALTGELGQLDKNAVGLWKVASAGKVVLVETGKLTIETLVAAGAAYVSARLVEGQPPPSGEVAASWAMQGASMAVGKFVHVRLASFTERWATFGEQKVHLLKRARAQEALARQLEQAGNTEAALQLLEQHVQLLQDEHALLADPAAVARIGLDATQVGVLRAGNEAALAETHTQSFEIMRLRFHGLEPLASNGLAWSGTRAQIEAAIGESGSAARNAHETAAGRWTADIAGNQVTFVETHPAPVTPQVTHRTSGPAGPDLHTHMMGVTDVDYFVHKLGQGSALAAFEALYATLASSPAAQKEAPHAWKVATTARAKIDGLRDASAAKIAVDGAARKALTEMLAAGEETPFDLTYPTRQVAVENLIDPGGGPYRNYTHDTMLALHDEGIGYSEQSVGIGKLQSKFPEAMMKELHSELAEQGKDVDVRFLAMVTTKALTGEAPAKGTPAAAKADADAAATRKKLDKVLARGDVIGIDIAGPERGLFSIDGMKTFEELYAIVSAAAHKRGRSLVVRPHVGEGYNEGNHNAHVDVAQKNLETLITKLEGMGYSPAKAEQDGVILRFGHATHATPRQLQRMAALGVIVEANIGSNLITGAVESLDKHPLLYNLYYGVDTVLGTDGGGVMRTMREDEYESAIELIESFRQGNPLMIGDQKVYFRDLSPDQQRRFSVEWVKDVEDTYHQRIAADDYKDSARSSEGKEP